MRRISVAVVAVAALLLSSAPSVDATESVTARAHTLFPLPAAPVLPEPCPPPPVTPGPPGAPLPAPIVAESRIPIVAAPPRRHVDLAPVTGKGIWVTVFPGDTIDARSLVATAKAAGLHQLWIRTGSSHDGFYGGPLLESLVPVAHAAGIEVIAWDFPTMSNPATDAARALDAVDDGADAFTADIETNAEGTYLTARRVAYYLSLVRGELGSVPIVATVPRILTGHPTTYPYAAEAPFVDVFAPMIFWSCTEPGYATSESLTPLSKLRPVAPIGQDYDMASEGGRNGLPSAQEIWRFLDVAKRSGAIGASLYDIESGGPEDLLALGRYPW